MNAIYMRSEVLSTPFETGESSIIALSHPDKLRTIFVIYIILKRCIQADWYCVYINTDLALAEG